MKIIETKYTKEEKIRWLENELRAATGLSITWTNDYDLSPAFVLRAIHLTGKQGIVVGAVFYSYMSCGMYPNLPDWARRDSFGGGCGCYTLPEFTEVVQEIGQRFHEHFAEPARDLQAKMFNSALRYIKEEGIVSTSAEQIYDWMDQYQVRSLTALFQVMKTTGNRKILLRDVLNNTFSATTEKFAKEL
jgi:hypothetical protein